MSQGRRIKDPSELSAAEWVREQLLADILGGRLTPGEKLSEVKLSSRLGCSRTPVREAFRHLEALGLLQFEKNRGVTVIRLDRRTMHNLYGALAQLDGACAEMAARLLPDGLRQALSPYRPSTVAHAALGEETHLHTLIYQAADNPVLTELARTTRCRLRPYWRLATHMAAQWLDVAPEAEQRVIHALLAADAGEARRAMTWHVDSARAAAEGLLA
ncbi:Transcriptional regulator [Candidatus Terasakiella magnetica]|nr:Transcriptional regulator [Candidatus Terasakiella magnetica]